MIKTTMKDAVGPASVPKTGSGSTSEPNLPSGMPGRDTSPNGVKEILRDGVVKATGATPAKTTFKDALVKSVK